MNQQINEGVFEKFPIIKTERLILRAFTQEDAPYLFKMRTNDRLMKYVDTKRPDRIEDTIEKIELMNLDFHNKKGISWAIIKKDSDEVIGYIGYWRLWKEHLRAEIGYILHPDWWGKGIMSEALNKILDFGFNNLKIHSIEANVNEQNIASMTLLKRKGFKQEAFFRENYFFEGKFLNSVIFCLLEQDFKRKTNIKIDDNLD